MTSSTSRTQYLVASLCGIFLAAFSAFVFVPQLGFTIEWNPQAASSSVATASAIVVAEKPCTVSHVPTPKPVKALYMSSWVAGTTDFKNEIVSLVEKTEANALVVDVKDYSGRIAFQMDNPEISAIGSIEERIPDICAFINELHEKNIYVIARIAVFQDNYLAHKRPELAIQNSTTGKPWREKEDVYWLDPGSREVWQYVATVGREAWRAGFDELNYDYIRFPSNGDLGAITYSFYDKTALTRADQIEQFFAYLDQALSDTGAPLSADLFGVTTTSTDDLGIGQILERALPYFDYIAPMVYPSHYDLGFAGYQNPAAKPYEIVTYAMERGIARAVAASSSPDKFRAWLQDFNLGATYGSEEIKKQKQALYDLGLDSWMLWDPKNTYTEGGLVHE